MGKFEDALPRRESFLYTLTWTTPLAAARPPGVTSSTQTGNPGPFCPKTMPTGLRSVTSMSCFWGWGSAAGAAAGASEAKGLAAAPASGAAPSVGKQRGRRSGARARPPCCWIFDGPALALAVLRAPATMSLGRALAPAAPEVPPMVSCCVSLATSADDEQCLCAEQ